MDTNFYITTSNNVPYAIWYANNPPPSNSGFKQVTPFTIAISAMDTGDHVIDLYAQYSKSQPYRTQNKWSHLLPTWRFEDDRGNIVNSVKTTDTTIYSGSNVVGVTGQASFYYIDDLGSQPGYPVVIWATMQVSSLPLYSESRNGDLSYPSYANSKVVAYLPHYINDLPPTELHITRNGIDPLSASTYWVNQVIPNVITINKNSQQFSECSCNGNSIFFPYPSSNSLGTEMGSIDKSVITLSSNQQDWISLENGTSSLYFQSYDINGFYSGGYTRNKVTTDVSTLNTEITAGVSVKYASLFRDLPYAWVSNPNNRTLCKIQSPYINNSFMSGITSWLDVNLPYSNISLDINAPYLTEKTSLFSLTGFGGIYGIAVEPCYSFWATDAEMDKVYKFSSDGQLLSTIDLSDNSALSAYGVSGGCTPAGISLDYNNGMWVTLFDSTSVLKFNRTNGSLLTAINPMGNQTYINLGSDPDYKPTLAETDQDNQVWVSYTNSLSSYLIKYSENGSRLLSVTLPLCSNPMDIVIDYNNNPWVSLTYHSGPTNSKGEVRMINKTTGTTLSSVSAIHPEYLTMDKSGNIWFTQGFNNVTKIDNTNMATTTYTVGTALPPPSTWLDSNDELYYNALEGITSDTYDRIWIVNSLENNVYILSGDSFVEVFNLPDAKTTWYLDSQYNVVTGVDIWNKSLQSFGDWNGVRYIQKYIPEMIYQNNWTSYLTGRSGLFNISDFENMDIRKFNESWDATTQIRDYALPEHLYNNEKLFLDYIGTMIGGLETSANSIGRRVYERVANFTPNHSDVDSANIYQLYSLAQMADVPIDGYNFEYPSELKRIMDIVSIPHKHLWGGRCMCNSNFKQTFNYCDNCGHPHATNRGEGIDTTTYIVTADVPFLAEYKFNRNNYELITSLSSNISVSAAAEPYLINDTSDYCYYEFIPTRCDTQVEGDISWDDEYTTLSESNSTLSAWYGDNQLVENMISYYIRKGLGY